jgi:hypothetical protein
MSFLRCFHEHFRNQIYEILGFSEKQFFQSFLKFQAQKFLESYLLKTEGENERYEQFNDQVLAFNR